MTDTEKIYVRLIDGTETWVPINARKIDKYKFEILDDEEYKDEDPSLLFEFYPGDIVVVEDAFPEDLEFKAVRIDRLSNHPDRKYLYFKFMATLHLMPTDKQTLADYGSEIRRIREEIKAGKFVYRGIRVTLQYIDISEEKNGSCQHSSE